MINIVFEIMTHEHQDRIEKAREQYRAVVDEVRNDVREQRRVNVGDRVTRGDITGVIAGLDTFSISNKGEPERFDTQYWLRVETPVDFHTRQECEQYGLEAGKAQDFWDGNMKWSKVSQPPPCP